MRRIEDIALELIMAERNKERCEAEAAPEGVVKYFEDLITRLKAEIDECEVE